MLTIDCEGPEDAGTNCGVPVTTRQADCLECSKGIPQKAANVIDKLKREDICE